MQFRVDENQCEDSKLNAALNHKSCFLKSEATRCVSVGHFAETTSGDFHRSTSKASNEAGVPFQGSQDSELGQIK